MGTSWVQIIQKNPILKNGWRNKEEAGRVQIIQKNPILKNLYIKKRKGK